VAAGTPTQSGDAIDTASRGVDLLAKLALIAQGLGVSAGGAQPGAAPAGAGYPPASGSTPTAGGAYPPSGGGVPPSAGGTQTGGSGTGTGGGIKTTSPATQLPAAGVRPQLALIPKGTVAGRVQTQAGQPLAAAQITVGDAKGQTDAQGQFTVPSLAPGQYTVTVTAVGYVKQSRSITLTAGETERMVVVMPRLTIAPFRAAPKTP
jgi:hypothetical protein